MAVGPVTTVHHELPAQQDEPAPGATPPAGVDEAAQPRADGAGSPPAEAASEAATAPAAEGASPVKAPAVETSAVPVEADWWPEPTEEAPEADAAGEETAEPDGPPAATAAPPAEAEASPDATAEPDGPPEETAAQAAEAEGPSEATAEPDSPPEATSEPDSTPEAVPASPPEAEWWPEPAGEAIEAEGPPAAAEAAWWPEPGESAAEASAAEEHAPDATAEPPAETVAIPRDAGQVLAAFYDRRAPAALAYCARLCEPEAIADAVEEAFGHVFTAAAGRTSLTEEELDRLLRDAVRTAAASRAPPSSRPSEAERAYTALSGDDAPALGRSLLGEMLEASPAIAPAPETRPRRRRFPLPHIARGWRRRIAIVLGVVGALLIAEAVVTLAWKEPFTAYLTAQTQDDLSKQLDSRRVALAANDQRELAAIHNPDARTRKRIALLAAHLDAAVPDGEALGRIQIDRIGIDFVFVQGTDAATLRKGPGHYHGDTLLPGEGGTVGIAGHRTTYEAPFREIDTLQAGDRITLRMPYGRFTYEVTGHRIVPADYRLAFAAGAGGTGGSGAATATSPGGDHLVLSACHPLYSATERILVDAKLVGAQPLGPAIDTSLPAGPRPSARDLTRRRTIARLKALGNRQLGPGMTGRDVRELQRLLGMPVTGTFDANTTAAVLAFQRDHGLPQVGVVGSQTKHALARRAHPPSRPPTPANVPEQKPTGPGGSSQGTRSGGYSNGTYRGPSQTTPYQTPTGTQSPPSSGRGGGTGNGR